MATALTLRVHPRPLSIVRLSADAPAPPWLFGGPGIAAAVRLDDELSLVCATDRVAAAVTREDGWIALEIEGPLDLALTGILATVATPLAEAGISTFALSTYDTDIILVRETALEDAVDALTAANHRVSRVS